MIKALVGLGNPGPKYKDTKHNIGFKVIDEIAFKLHLKNPIEKYMSIVFHIKEKDVYLIKPQTFMNNSGIALRQFVEKTKIAPSDILVIYDDMDLPIDTIKIKPNGGSGGHNGVESIIRELRTQDFPRLRIGIGRPASKEEVTNYVLSPFEYKDTPIVKKTIEKASECAIRSLEEPLEYVMTLCNTKSS
ncbi:MAG: aminoacyl-tRNA hydrolase [Hydrogenobaculum sp.]